MSKYSLFEIYGIEAEYMIVDRKTLQVRTFAEHVLSELNGGPVENEVSLEDVAWSNELVSHVVELKTDPPIASLDHLDEIFHKSILQVQDILKSKDAILLPTAMHPWFDPDKETQLWPYGQKDIYQKYDEIFSCKGHGWSNLQSVHINLPFKDEVEFSKLMPAVRFVLPFIPYLAASSPYHDGAAGINADNRLDVYERNQKRIASITGDVIPEPIYDFAGYHQMLESLYRDIAPLDPEKILQHSWLNSRGAITKFDVGAIEIRVMDINESPLVDIALVSFITNWIKHISLDSKVLEQVANFPQKRLVETYQQAKTMLEFEIDRSYFEVMQLDSKDLTINAFLSMIHDRFQAHMNERHNQVIGKILSEGNLAKRLVRNSSSPSFDDYRKLAECLATNKMY